MKVTRLLISVSGVQAIGMGLLLILHVLLSRMMGAEHYGVFVYVMAWVNVAAIFGKFGMDRGVVRLISHSMSFGDFTRISKHLRWSAKVVVGFTLITAAITVVLFMLVEGLGAGEIRVSATIGIFVLFFVTWSFFQKGLLLAFGAPVISKFPTEVLRPVIMIIGIMVLYLVPSKLTASKTMLLTLISYLIVVLVCHILIVRIKRLRKTDTEHGVDNAESPKLFDFFPFVVISVSHTFMRYTDILLLGAIAGPEQVAHYSVAARVVSLVGFVQRASSPVVQPMISSAFSLGAMGEIREILLKITALVSLATMVISVILLTWGIQVLSIFGTSFADGYLVLVILLFGQFVSVLAGPNGAVLSMTNNQRIAARALWAAAFFNLLGNIVMIPSFGAVGAAVSTATTTILWNFLLVRACVVRVKVDPSIVGVMRLAAKLRF